jgi:catechol 2,3-dioxygenase-like lactoylglutathione lyase family enzyme
MAEYLIGGIQQVGVGIPDLGSAFRWYRRCFGLDVAIFEDRGAASLMPRYTGGEPQERHAVLAANLQGGAGLEIWQFTRRRARPPGFQVQLGDLGINAVRIKARDARVARERLKLQGAELVGELGCAPGGEACFFVRDPHGLLFQVVEEAEGWFSRGRWVTGGVAGCQIGVSDPERARRLYGDLLGWDRVLYDREGVFPDLAAVPGGEQPLRRMLLEESAPRRGAFSPLLGPGRIELLQSLGRQPRRIFEGRYWGDLGFIHLCLDVHGTDALKQACAAARFPFTVDSGEAFDMGQAAGRFAYAEDPDGTLVEFVETYRLGLVQKLGLSLDLRRREVGKPLPRLLLRALALKRVRD